MLMKKAIIVASAAIILAAGATASWTVFGGNEDDFFNENLEALMDNEAHTDGTCMEEEYACVGYCPGCGELVEAMGDHKGPAGVIHHCQ